MWANESRTRAIELVVLFVYGLRQRLAVCCIVAITISYRHQKSWNKMQNSVEMNSSVPKWETSRTAAGQRNEREHLNNKYLNTKWTYSRRSLCWGNTRFGSLLFWRRDAQREICSEKSGNSANSARTINFPCTSVHCSAQLIFKTYMLRWSIGRGAVRCEERR